MGRRRGASLDQNELFSCGGLQAGASDEVRALGRPRRRAKTSQWKAIREVPPTGFEPVVSCVKGQPQLQTADHGGRRSPVITTLCGRSMGDRQSLLGVVPRTFGPGLGQLALRVEDLQRGAPDWRRRLVSQSVRSRNLERRDHGPAECWCLVGAAMFPRSAWSLNPTLVDRRGREHCRPLRHCCASSQANVGIVLVTRRRSI